MKQNSVKNIAGWYRRLLTTEAEIDCNKFVFIITLSYNVYNYNLMVTTSFKGLLSGNHISWINIVHY